MKDPFDVPVTNLKLKDWAALLPKPSQPARAASSTSAAASIIRMARERDQLQKIKAKAPKAPPQLLTFQQLVDQDPGFEALPYSEKSKRYNDFIDESTARLLEYDDKLDQFAIDEEIRNLNPAPKKPERDWMGLATDIGTGVAAGAVGLVSLPVAVADAIRGEQSELGAGLESTAADIRSFQSPVVEDARRQMAFDDAVREADEDLGFVGRRLSEAKSAISNLSAGTVAELVPQLLGPGLVGLGTRVAVKSLVGATAGKVAGTAALSGSAAALAGGDAATQARDAIRELSDEEFRMLPEYGEAMNQAGGDEAKAKEIMSQGVAKIAAGIAAPLSAVFAAVPGSLDRMIAGATGRGAAKSAIVQGAKAGVIGGVDEAATGIAGNIGAATAIPDTDIFEGSGGDFALGALLEGGVGTAGGALSNRGVEPTPRPRARDAELTTADVLGELGAGEEALASTPAAVSFVTEDGGSTSVVQREDGVWDYENSDSPRTTGADEFISAMNLEPQELSSETQVAEAETQVAEAETQVAETAEAIAQQEQADAQLAQALGIEEVPVAVPATATETAEFEAILPQLQASLAVIDTPDGSPTDRVQALRTIQQLVSEIPPATRVALRSGALEGAPPEVLRVVSQLGVENLVGDNPGAPWAIAATQPEAQGSTVLTALTADPEAGAVNQAVAGHLLRAYDAAGVPVPDTSFTPEVQRYRGSYTPARHAVSLNPSTTANTVVHEMMHGLTVQGLIRLEALAQSGNVEAADLISLLLVLRGKLEHAAGGEIYGTTNVAEMFAEMVRPEFIAVAMNTPLGTLPARVEVDGVVGSPQAALTRLGLQSSSSIFEAISRMVRAVIQAIGGGAIPEGSIAEVLTLAASEVAENSSAAMARASTRARLRAESEAAAPVAQPTTSSQTITLPDPELPTGLRRAAPRYQGDSVRFENDLDRAAYIAANSNNRRSTHDARYLQFVQDHTGWTESQVREYGDTVRERVRETESVGGARFVRSAPVAVPTPSGAPAIRLSDMANTTTVNGLKNFASQAEAEGLTRAPDLPQPGSVLATLIAEDASIEARQQYLVRAFEQGLRLNRSGLTVSEARNGSEGTVLTVRDSDRTVKGQVFLTNGSLRAKIDSTGFEAGSGSGGKFYDAVNGAIIVSRMRASNGELTAVNKRRIPINRLRSILKWGAVLNNFDAAAKALAVGPNTDVQGLPSAATSATASNNVIIGNLAARVAAQAEANAPEPGAIRFTTDGLFTAGNGRVMSYPELVTWATSIPMPVATLANQAAWQRERVRRAAASPDAMALAGLVRSLTEAQTQADLDALVESAILEATPLFDMDLLDADSPTVSVPNPTGAPKAAAERNAAGKEEAESLVGDADTEVLSTRDSYHTVLEDAEAGAAAEPASILRGFRQGLWSGNTEQIKDALSKFFSEANEKFHDSLTPVNNWLNGIANSWPSVEQFVNQVRDAMYLAPGRRDHFMREAMLNHGGREMNQALGRLARATGKTEETVFKWVGYWLTAERAPVANQMLIERATQAVTQAQRDLSKSPGDPDLQRALAFAVTELKDRVLAVNNPDVSVTEHTVSLAGGVSNAQAVALRNAVEKYFTRAQLDSVAKHVYRLNAYRLALDIETGKTDPEVAGKFLRQPELVDKMKALRNAGQALNSADPASVDALNVLRDEIAAMVRSNYVPMTGDPTVGLDAELFPTGAAAPNVRADRAMQGRRSIPDDGITASLSALSASTAFAGWRPFQVAISNLYNQMTPEAQQAAGFGRRTLANGEQGDANGIIYRTNGRSYVYTVRDPSVLGAIKKNNVDDVSNLLRFLGAPTKAFAYMATQANPFFAPRNWFRDLWERSEIVRTRDLLLPDGAKANTKAIANRMWKYGFDPAVFVAAARFAAGRPDNGSRGFRALKELSERGGLTTFGDQFSRDRAQAITDIVRSVSLPAQLRRSIAQVIDVYNRTFDLVPVVSAFMAMQDFNMDNQAAAAASLDTMNFRKSGTAMPLARALYAFAQPAVTGGANIMSSLYNRRTGKINYRVGVPRLMAYTITLLGIQALARSIADDDEGGNKLTQLSSWVVNNTIAFPVGDKIVTIPLAFGMPRIANGMAMAMLNVGQNEQSAKEALGDFVSGSLIPAVSPLDPVDIDFNKRPGEALMASFAPTWLKPIVGLGINRTDFDAPIEDFRWEKTDQFRSEQYGANQAPFWKDVARAIRTSVNIDMTPNQVRHLVRGYALGVPSLVLSGAVDNPFRESQGKQTSSPITGWLIRNHSESAIRGQFYKGIEDTDSLLRTRAATGSGDLSEEDRRLLALRSQWDTIDAELRKKTAAITRRKGMTDKAKEAAKANIRKTREAYQTDFVRRMRGIKGMPVGG